MNGGRLLLDVCPAISVVIHTDIAGQTSRRSLPPFRNPVTDEAWAAVESVLFEAIDEATIYKSAKNIFGSAGPTHIDSDGWKNITYALYIYITIYNYRFYGKKSDHLRTSIANMRKRICTKEVKPDCLGELLSCRLIPLKKNDPKDVRLICDGYPVQR